MEASWRTHRIHVLKQLLAKSQWLGQWRTNPPATAAIRQVSRGWLRGKRGFDLEYILVEPPNLLGLPARSGKTYFG